MLKFGCLVLACWASLTADAFAQRGAPGPMTPEALRKLAAHAEKFHPPRLTRYAARVAQQPDMTVHGLPCF